MCATRGGRDRRGNGECGNARHKGNDERQCPGNTPASSLLSLLPFSRSESADEERRKITNSPRNCRGSRARTWKSKSEQVESATRLRVASRDSEMLAWDCCYWSESFRYADDFETPRRACRCALTWISTTDHADPSCELASGFAFSTVRNLRPTRDPDITWAESIWPSRSAPIFRTSCERPSY